MSSTNRYPHLLLPYTNIYMSSKKISLSFKYNFKYNFPQAKKRKSPAHTPYQKLCPIHYSLNNSRTCSPTFLKEETSSHASTPMAWSQAYKTKYQVPSFPYPDIMLEHISSNHGGEDIVHNQLAECGQEIPPLVQLLNLDMLILLFCSQRKKGT